MSAFIHKVFNPFLSPPTTTHGRENHLPSNTAPRTSPSTTTTTSTSATPYPLRPVTVIELFQSQGCNSCPPANTALVARASRPAAAAAATVYAHADELLLTYEVTYWDYLGWADTFGDRRWDARQTAYARALAQRSCYTPQVIVDGGARPMGSSWRNLGAVLATAAAAGGRGADGLVFEAVEVEEKEEKEEKEEEVERGGRRRGVKITGGERGNSGGRAALALVLVVEFEAEPKPVRILRGENRGETERYRNVVRDLKTVGTWEGGEVVVELPARTKGLEMAVLVQAGDGGHILGAARV